MSQPGRLATIIRIKQIEFSDNTDVWPGVFAYGILLVPKDIKPGEKRPVVVCQHGLEGRPSETAEPGSDSHYYHRFAAKLAEEGFITFSPQNRIFAGTASG